MASEDEEIAGKKPVLVEGNFQLFKTMVRGFRIDLPEAGADYFVYWLHNKKDNKLVLAVSCQIPQHGDNKNLYPIGVVHSQAANGLLKFPKMVELIRTDLRKTNKRADLSSWGTTTEMERYYRRRLGARKRKGHLRFPQKIGPRRK